MAAVSDAERPELPSGLLTFLMTDVVGSTVLWERAPGLMDAALTRHDHLIESVVEAHGGLLLKHRGEGDSTFCVFESAVSAAAAAIAAQRSFAEEVWDEATPIAVRIGIHTGESILRGRDYYGQTVNRSARVRAVATGGQVLLSGTTAAIVRMSLPPDTELRYLRHEKLRGIERPEVIHELVDRRRPIVLPADADAPVSWPLPPSLEAATVPRFAGRGALIEQLTGLLGKAADGQAQVVMLGGEPGAGKSSIAAHLAQRAHDQGWVVLAGACDSGVAMPYQPFREAFGWYVDSAPITVLAQHVTEHGGELARLAPQLSARVGVVAPVEALVPETTRQLLSEAATDLIGRAAAEQPVLLVLDDLQWADRNTTLLVSRLARLGAAVPLMILGTFRSEHADNQDLLSVLLSDLSALPNYTGIVVGGLDLADLIALLERAAGHALGDAGPSVATYLLDQTGGNPYFATELLRHFAETGVIGTDERGTWRVNIDPTTVSVPRTVRSVLRTRMSRLGPACEQVLGLAAVAGREFDTQLLATVLSQSELSVLNAVETAVESALVREVGVGRFEFAHALVQTTIYEGIGATRRSLYHRELAEAIESAFGETGPAGVLSDHWAATGRDDRARVAYWSARAGAAAMAALSPEEAEHWYRRALDAAGEDERPRLELLIGLGDAQRWAGSGAFRQTLLDAAALAKRLGDHDALVRAALANNRGGTSASGVVDRERIATLEHALAVVGDEDSPHRACLLATLAIELSQDDDWQRRVVLADDAVACARRLRDEMTLLKVLLLTTEATRLPSTLARRLVDTEELFSIATRLGDPVLLGTAAVRQLRVKMEGALFDQMDDARAVLEEVAGLNPYARWNRIILDACLAQVRGDVPAALVLASQARGVAVADGQPDAAAVYVAQVAGMHWDASSLGTLLPLIEQTVRANPRITGFRAFLGLAYCDVDRFDEAAQILAHEVASRFADHPLSPIWLITMSVFASLCIELDDADAAALLYEQLDPWRGRANASTVSINGFVTESLAGLALACGRLEQAETDCAEAMEQAERTGAAVSCLRIRLTHARLLLRRNLRGDLDTALLELEHVREQATRWEMTTVVRRVQQLQDSRDVQGVEPR